MNSAISLRTKVVIVSGALLLVVALFIAVFFPLRQAREMGKYLDSQTLVVAELTAQNVASALVFEDIEAVKTSLQLLQSAPEVQFALVYKDGAEVSSYNADQAKPLKTSIDEALKAQPRLSVMGSTSLAIVPIVGEKGIIGTLALGLSRRQLEADVLQSRIIAIVIGISIVLLGVSLIWYVITHLTKPLQTLVEAADRVAKGDMNISVDDSTRDEIGKLASGFNTMVKAIHAMTRNLEQEKEMLSQRVREILVQMARFAEGDLTAHLPSNATNPDIAKLFEGFNNTVENMRNLVSQVVNVVEQTVYISTHLSSNTEEMFSAVNMYNHQTEKIATEIHSITGQMQTNADNANAAMKIAHQSREFAVRGNGDMNNLMQALEENNEASRNIIKIIKVIDEIAFQTNLLALNAAVEAARAGRHGKGFAVVAEEVRALAGRSAKAARETNLLIETAVSKAEHGITIARQTTQSLGDIQASSSKVSDIISEISLSASGTQLHSAQEASLLLNGINTVSGQTLQSINHIKQVTEQITALTDNLRVLVSQFRIDSDNDRPLSANTYISLRR